MVDGAGLFALSGGAGAEFGSAVHSLLAEVDWSSLSLRPGMDREKGGGEWEKWEATWRARGEDAAARVALACLGAPGLAGVWVQPDSGAEVWRERAFEVVLDGAWVSGVFDRVVVARDPAGRATRATVFDFKTDATPDVVRHAGQMRLYRRAAARLLGLPETAVHAELVFTATQVRVEITF